MKLSRLLIVSSMILAPMLGAQAPKYLFSPSGAEFMQGGTNNTIPWWSMSATYQQVYDFDEMVAVTGGKALPIIMKGLGFRPSATFNLPGRSWDLQLSMGHCPNTSAAASTTFTANLPKPTVVFGTSTTFSKFSFQTVRGISTTTPNPIAFTVPFKSSFIYVPIKNTHFCWEWRHKNGSLNTSMPCDAIHRTSSRGIAKTSVGSGCGGAKSVASVVKVGGVDNYQTQLTGAPGGARALMMVGLQRKKTPLPGWCSSLELVPLIHVYGNANTSGIWTLQGPLTSFGTSPSFELLVQYAFAATSQPLGVGLSDMSVYQTPLRRPPLIARIYSSIANRTTNGQELATTGSRTTQFGLVVAFQQ